MGTTPRAENTNGSMRFSRPLSGFWLASVSIGLAHQLTPRLSSPAATMAATAPVPSLVASHRVRVTVWFHTRLCVPVSSSRVTIGTPQKTPTTAGSRYITRMVPP